MLNFTMYCWCVGEREDRVGMVFVHAGTGWGQFWYMWVSDGENGGWCTWGWTGDGLDVCGDGWG